MSFHLVAVAWSGYLISARKFHEQITKAIYQQLCQSRCNHHTHSHTAKERESDKKLSTTTSFRASGARTHSSWLHNGRLDFQSICLCFDRTFGLALSLTLFNMPTNRQKFINFNHLKLIYSFQIDTNLSRSLSCFILPLCIVTTPTLHSINYYLFRFPFKWSIFRVRSHSHSCLCFFNLCVEFASQSKCPFVSRIFLFSSTELVNF